MMVGNHCDCLVCRLETSLIDELDTEQAVEKFRLWAATSDILSAFPTALDLVAHLHRQSPAESSSVDRVILELVRGGTNGTESSLWQSILLLVFVPTIHRTTTQVSAAFPPLGRDDAAQHLFVTLIEFIRSADLRSHRSHVAFFVARRMRRSAFRWAIRESRLDLPTDWDSGTTESEEIDEASDEPDTGILLEKFLDDCQQRGWLSEEERTLLEQFKLEGVSAAELALASGHSVMAIYHRIQRLLERLRRIARNSGSRVRSEQLELFRP
jgi:DNA-directed RNA polymerase specialized sigma24 family protein